MTRRDNEPTASRHEEHPTWLTEPCPDWCAREHSELDHPDDRFHQSGGSIVPAVVAPTFAIPLTASLERLDLIVWTGRYVGKQVEWLVIEPVEQREPRLMVTLETARELVDHVTQELVRHEAP